MSHDVNNKLHNISPIFSPHMIHWSTTLHCDQFMALLVHQQFAVDAFVSLPPQTPDTVRTDGAMGSLLKDKRHFINTYKHVVYTYIG